MRVGIILFLVIGGVAGWLAGLIGLSNGSLLGSLVMALGRAVVLLFTVGLIKKP